MAESFEAMENPGGIEFDVTRNFGLFGKQWGKRNDRVK
jgi:hypothetical protein